MIGRWRRGKPKPLPVPPTLIVEFTDTYGNQLWLFESQRPLDAGDTFTVTLDKCVSGKDDAGMFIRVPIDYRGT